MKGLKRYRSLSTMFCWGDGDDVGSVGDVGSAVRRANTRAYRRFCLSGLPVLAQYSCRRFSELGRAHVLPRDIGCAVKSRIYVEQSLNILASGQKINVPQLCKRNPWLERLDKSALREPYYREEALELSDASDAANTASTTPTQTKPVQRRSYLIQRRCFRCTGLLLLLNVLIPRAVSVDYRYTMCLRKISTMMT